MTLNGDNDEFLREIRSNPDEDTLRLAYADWLDEHDEHDRAELIRVQCEAARLRCISPYYPETIRLDQRAEDLVAAHMQDWLGPLKDYGVTKAHFSRGMIDGIEVPETAFVAHSEEILQAAPSTLHRLKIIAEHRGTRLPLGQRLAACPGMLQIDSLDLDWCDLGEGGCGALARSPHLCNVRDLKLSNTFIGDTGLTTLCHSPNLSGLTRLDLACRCEIGPQGVRELAGSGMAEQLEHLDLTGSLIGREGLRELARGHRFRNLLSLRLGNSEVYHAGRAYERADLQELGAAEFPPGMVIEVPGYKGKFQDFKDRVLTHYSYWQRAGDEPGRGR